MYPKQTTEPKVMTFWSFEISVRVLCPSNQLGCWISLHLIVDLAKTYENERSQCSNDQIIKNLWLLEVRKLLMHCDATQYSKAFGSVGCVDLEKLDEINKNVTQTDDCAKSYDISKFQNFYAHFMLVQWTWMLDFSTPSCGSPKNVWQRVVTVLKWPSYKKHMASGCS